MKISKVIITEFEYLLESVGSHHGHQVYDPGNKLSVPGFILEVESDIGISGEYRSITFAKPMISQIEAASGLILGRNPTEREGIWEDLWRAFRHTDHLGLGPIDIALWDLAGKYYDAPVSELIGGYRHKIPAYASTFFMDQADDGLSGPEAFADFALDCIEKGYPGFKIHGHPAGKPDVDIAICKAVAEVADGEMDLMLDPASTYRTYQDALRVGRVLDDLGFYWYEDPMTDTGQSMHAGASLANALDTPLLGLEHVRTGPFGRADHITANAADLVRADVHQDGGITGALKIAHVAHAFGVDVELHIGGPATLHALSAIRNSNYFEHSLVHPREIDWMNQLGYTTDHEVMDKDGNVEVPQGPGLGVEIDWDYVDEQQTNTIVDDSIGTGDVV